MDRINQRIATELGVGIAQVAATVELLAEGATVPFIARYRKERPAAWTIRSCASWRNGSAICASWKTAARRC